MKDIHHCKACMERLGLVKGSGTRWTATYPCSECGEVKICEEGRKAIRDVMALMSI